MSLWQVLHLYAGTSVRASWLAFLAVLSNDHFASIGFCEQKNEGRHGMWDARHRMHGRCRGTLAIGMQSTAHARAPAKGGHLLWARGRRTLAILLLLLRREE